MTQFARPAADDSVGGWTNELGSATNLYASIDESVVSTADYAQSSSWPNNETFRYALSPTVIGPFAVGDQVVSYSFTKIGSNPLNMRVRLVEGTSTEIASWTHLDVAAGQTDVNQTLTVDQVAAITDYTNLFLEVTANPSQYLINDLFITDQNPLVDGSAEPGPGKRQVTGSLWKLLNGRLRGGMQSSPSWGASKVIFTDDSDGGLPREDGLTLWTIVNAANRDADLGIGWADSAAVTDPTTNGHHWLMNEGYGRISQPSKLITLCGLNQGDVGQFRATEYLVGVTLRNQGAFYWISGIAPITGPTTYTADQVGIPQYPDARVLWVEDVTTTSPMYPHITAYDGLSHPDGHAIEQFRQMIISDWATDAGMATFLERFNRADSATSAGPGWTNAAGVGGVSGNAAYIVSNPGTRTFIEYPGAATSGDGIWRWKVTVGDTTSDQIECHFRYVDNNNFCIAGFWSGAVWLVDVIGGSGTTIGNYPVPLSVGQVLDVCVVTKGNRYQLYVDGNLLIDWGIGADGVTKTGTGIGYGSWGTVATGARWNDFMIVPSTVTLPADIQMGASPHIYTPGTTVLDDTFSGTDGDPINGRTPDTTGTGTWTTFANGANGTWTIQGNRAANDSLGGGISSFAYYDSGSPDVEVTIDYVAPATGGFASGVLLRYTDSTHFVAARVLGGVGSADNEIEILEANGASENIQKFQQIGGFHAASGAYTMKCQIVDDVLHVFLNDIPIISYIVHIPDSSNHGLFWNDISGALTYDRCQIKTLS